MLLAKTTFWVALVAVSYKDPSLFIPAKFKDVRVIQHITLMALTLIKLTAIWQLWIKLQNN